MCFLVGGVLIVLHAKFTATCMNTPIENDMRRRNHSFENMHVPSRAVTWFPCDGIPCNNIIKSRDIFSYGDKMQKKQHVTSHDKALLGYNVADKIVIKPHPDTRIIMTMLL